MGDVEACEAGQVDWYGFPEVHGSRTGWKLLGT